MEETEAETTSSGVQDLIDRIRDDGVQAGVVEAERIIRKAKREAASRIAAAREEAEAELEKARAQIAIERESAEESLKLAARDTIKELGIYVRAAFERQLKNLVTSQLEDRDFLREVILALASRTAEKNFRDRAVVILINDKLIEGETDDREAEERIRRFVLGTSSEVLREGIEFKLDPHVETGVSVQVVGEDLRIDLNDSTISEFLVRHLLPRYRRILADDSLGS